MHIEILVEDSSGMRLLEHLVPRIIGPNGDRHTYQFHAYRGVGKIPSGFQPTTDARKRILLDQLPKVLRGYSKTTGIDAVVVVLDADRNDCRSFLAELTALAAKVGAPDTVFRLAIEEVEAWYLGDREAMRAAYPKAKLDAAKNYSQDSVCGTWELVADVLHKGGRRTLKKKGAPRPCDLKHEWAEKIGPRLDLDRNESPSFQKLLSGLRRIVGIGPSG